MKLTFNSTKWEQFLTQGNKIELTFDGSHASVLDQIFVCNGKLENGNSNGLVNVRPAHLSGVKRLMLHLKVSRPAQQLTENTLTWINHWNTKWAPAVRDWKDGKEGTEQRGRECLEAALRSCKRLVYDVISDHFPITTEVEVDFS